MAQARWSGWTRRLTGALLCGALLCGGAGDERAFAQGKADSRSSADAEAERLEKQIEALGEDGQYDVALPLAERALALRKQDLPAGDVKIGSAMGDLGTLHLLLGDHLRAEPLLEGAVAVIEKAKPDSKELAVALLNLAGFYNARGESRAGALVDRAITIYEKVGGPDNPDLGRALRLRAQLLGRGPEAKKLLQRARAIHEKAKDERQVVNDILTLARFERAGQASTEAINLYNEAIPRAEKAYGPDHPQMITVHLAVADFWRREGTQDRKKFENANAAFQRAERIVLAVFGPKHTRLAEVYSEWSTCAQAQNDMPRAVELRAKANDIEEEHLASVLASGSEQVKQAYLNKLARHADDTVSLHLWGGGVKGINDQAAARLALTTILRRKGRVLDAVAQGVTGLSARMSSDDKKLLAELNKTRSDLASLMIRGPGAESPTDYQARIKDLSDKATSIEAQASKSSAALRAETAPVTLEAVQAAIPEDAALVEIYRYDHRNAKAYSASVESGGGFTTKYVGYVLRRTGRVGCMYFEEASSIENVVNQFRAALADPERRDVLDPAWRLYAMTLSHLEPMLASSKRILISPDGALNLVPFAAMIDVKNKFLAERWAFSYLSSGRDLLRFKVAEGVGQQPIVIGNPDYDAGGARSEDSGGKTRAGDLSRAKFTPLPGTQGEAEAIHKIIPQAAMLTATDATEAALKQVHGPEFLHVATHGFFLANTKKEQRGSRALVLEKDVPAAARPTFKIKDPLLRSGLALAGANVKRGGDDDGILTALEASGLDLHGTKMVVLSACETGIGEFSYGEGVFGLRRALVIAGSETQVMSLWKVDDDATRQLMSSYYDKLIKGAGRSDAMREVQLTMMKNKETAHPFYWASFIVSGNPGPLGWRPGEGPAGSGGSVPKVEPGARGGGCGCEVAGRSPQSAPSLLAAAAIAAAMTRLRRRRTRRLTGALLSCALVAGGAADDRAFAQGKVDSRSSEDEADRLEKQADALAEEGQYDLALTLAERMLALRKQARPADEVKIGSAMDGVGVLHLFLNDHLRAEPMLEGSVALLEKAAPESKELAHALINLAGFYNARGERRAGALIDRAITIYEKVSPDDVALGVALRLRAQLLGPGAESKKLLQRARAIHEKATAEREVVSDILTLAQFERAERASYDALDLYNEATARAEKAYGPDHPNMISVHLAIAEFLRREGTQSRKEFERANAAYERAERVALKALGPKHTRLAEVYSEWSLCAQTQHDMPRAVEFRAKANDIEEEHLSSVLASGSEQVKRAYLNRLAEHADETVALHLWGNGFQGINDQAAARLALTTILRRKGRVLDAVAQGMNGLSARMSAADKALLAELTKVRSDLSSLMIRGPGAESPTDYQARIKALSDRAAAIEAQVSASSAALRAETAPITLEAVQAAIPEDAALIEIYRYRHRSVRAYSASEEAKGGYKYAGYFVRRSGPVLAMSFDDAVVIEKVVDQFRAALADPERRNVGDPAWRLFRMTLSQIGPVFGDTKRILISPDGALNLVPFAAMIDVEKQFLARRWAFSYLSSGRDLLRFKVAEGVGQPPIVIANPDYDAGGARSGDSGGKTRAGDLSRAKFTPLPGTQGEADAIHKVIPKASMLTASQATEAALKQVRGPEFLHVATHGFFIANTSKEQRGSRALVLEKDTPAAARPTLKIKDPLLRSGLALAGANVKRGGDDDGILTALEASGLDLHGTKMVVLSACETGIGEFSYGEGVFGLRRALVIAGSETQVMSLWKVDDDATRQLMSSYYEKLMKGGGRSEAMREVQVAMMDNKETAHPFYWASFIVSGNPGPLGWRPGEGPAGPGGSVPKVEPGARGGGGCGCEVAGRSPEGALSLLVAAGFAASIARLTSIGRRRAPRRARRSQG